MGNKAFKMKIEDVLHIRGRGLVVTGYIESGEVSIGDIVRIEAADGQLIKENLTLDGIEILENDNKTGKGMKIGMFFMIPYIQTKKKALEILPVKIGHMVKK